MKLKSIEGVDVRGKRVLLRASLNAPVTAGAVIDDFRLARAAATISLLSAAGARVIILAHIGRAGESLGPAVEALRTHLGGIAISFRDTRELPTPEDLAYLQDGEVVVLENVRALLGEEENDAELSVRMAQLADVYVNDAFADSHRPHASIVGIPRHLPSYAGLLLLDEVKHLTEALSPGRPSVAIFGGAKFETKEPLMRKFVPLYDRVCVGGAIVNDFFRAKGYEVGISLTSKSNPDLSGIIDHPHVEIPNDIVAAREEGSRVTEVSDVEKDERIADAGPKTGARWAQYIHEASFVLMNGPLGIYEQGFNAETERLAQALAASGARAVVGGGDTIAAIRTTNFDPSRIFLSTGGGAMLEFLVEGTLPGIELLQE